LKSSNIRKVTGKSKWHHRCQVKVDEGGTSSNILLKKQKKRFVYTMKSFMSELILMVFWGNHKLD